MRDAADPKAQNACHAGTVFSDEACAGWGEINIFEKSVASPVVAHFVTNETAKLANWSLVEVAGRGKVLDVNYGQGSEWDGYVRIQTTGSSRLYLTAYSLGALRFDLRVLNYGGDNDHLQLRLECGYPCVADEVPVSVQQLNQWETITVTANQLTMFDYNSTDVPFQLIPVVGSQTGARYQIDNIRWIQYVY